MTAISGTGSSTAPVTPVVDGLLRIDTFVTGTRMPLALYLLEGVAGFVAAESQGRAGTRGGTERPGRDPADTGAADSGGWLLTDTGCVGMVDDLVLPVVEALQPGAAIDVAVVCHAHADHFGGNAELLAANPGCRLYAHRDDVAWAREPALHIRESYDRLEPEFTTPSEVKDWVAGLLGPPTPVAALDEGDRFELADGSALTVLHLPGHSPGHCGLWHAERGVLLASDAILGDGQWADGRLDAVPSYLDVEAYLGSIARIRELGAELLCTAHFPLLEGAAVRKFCDLSEEFVHRLEAALRRALAAGGRRTLKELTMETIPLVAKGVTPSVTAAVSVQAHLDRLLASGVAVAEQRAHERLWSLT